MIYTSNEFKYAECDLCGQERECLVQHKSGKEQAVCVHIVYLLHIAISHYKNRLHL